MWFAFVHQTKEMFALGVISFPLPPGFRICKHARLDFMSLCNLCRTEKYGHNCPVVARTFKGGDLCFWFCQQLASFFVLAVWACTCIWKGKCSLETFCANCTNSDGENLASQSCAGGNICHPNMRILNKWQARTACVNHKWDVNAIMSHSYQYLWQSIFYL